MDHGNVGPPGKTRLSNNLVEGTDQDIMVEGGRLWTQADLGINQVKC